MLNFFNLGRPIDLVRFADTDTLELDWLETNWQPFINRPKVELVKNLQLRGEPDFFSFLKQSSFYENRSADICLLMHGLGRWAILSLGYLFGIAMHRTNGCLNDYTNTTWFKCLLDSVPSIFFLLITIEFDSACSKIRNLIVLKVLLN